MTHVSPGMTAPGAPWGPQPGPAPARGTGRLAWLVGGISLAVIVIVVAVVVVVNGGRGSTSAPSTGGAASGGATTATTATTVAIGPVTASTALRADRGTVVYTDDFHDPGSGWSTEGSAQSTRSYGRNAFLMTGSGNFLFQEYSPYTESIAQIGMTATATESASAPPGSGLGVVCDRGLGFSDIHYEFLLTTTAQWLIDRHKGVGTNPTVTLKEGTAPAAASSIPATVTGMCATQTDGRTTRLAMFVNGTLVADITDSATLPEDGWIGGICIFDVATPSSTVTTTKFSQSDLGR